MKRIIICLMFTLSILSCEHKKITGPSSNDTRDILEKLESIPDIDVTEIAPGNGFNRQFEIYISQPLDHANPEGIRFKQRIYLSHIDEKNPVVFMPSGYSSSPVKVSELTGPLQANQIYAAHRFMLGAEPSPLQWEFLTIAQASADFHHIVEIFKNIYAEPWVSYGVSKNGQAALYHRRFYPDDVSATVSVGAALSLAEEDPRYETFLNTVGSEGDRDKIKQFQRTVLMKKENIIPLIRNYLDDSEFHFTRMTPAEIIEYEVLEYPFSFWQVTDGDCTRIPDTTATPLQLYVYLKNFGYFDSYSDELLEFFQPVYYQAFTELGWYRLIDDHLQGIERVVKNPSYRNLAPPGAVLTYNPQVMPDIINWLQSDGQNIIYIYGGNDPWSAGGIESVGSTNSIKISQPGANHGLRITDLDQQSVVWAALENWLDVSVNPGTGITTEAVSCSIREEWFLRAGGSVNEQ